MGGRDHQVATDARLTIAAGQGDDDAFAVLYERYAPRIGAYLMRLVGDEHLAQDLTHEVFVSALRRLRTDRPPIAFGPWLYRIARNASIDVHRRSQIVRQVPLDGNTEEPSASASGSAPEAAAEVRQWLEQLRDVLGGLSESHRSVLVLRELEGLSNGEIGRRMGLSRPAVEGLLFRARAKMRREYDDLVSGRRCAGVQASLDRAGSGQPLAGRELQLVSRHARACAQCRRHAWDAGVSEMVREADTTVPRRVLALPPLAAAMIGRLHLKLHHAARVVEPSAGLGVPWGRVAAAATALAVAGGTVGPHLGDAPDRDARAAVARGGTARPAAAGHTILASAPAVGSPAAVPTTLRASAAREPVVAVPAGPPASPAAAPTALPGGAPSPRDAQHETHPAERAPVAPAPAPASDHPAIAAVAGAVDEAEKPGVVAQVVHDATEREAGGVVSQAAQTASAALEAVSKAGPAEEPADHAADTVSQVAGAAADAVPTVAAPAAAPPVPDPAPVPAPPVPAAPPVASTPPDVAPPAPADAPAPSVEATPPPADPRVPGAALAERRSTTGLR